MKRVILAGAVVLAFLGVGSIHGFASDDADGGDGAEYQNCDGSTVDMIECVNGFTERWDDRLNSAYREVSGTLKADRKTELRDVQRLWIGYRGANCAYYAGGEGSIARIEAAICLYSLTRTRAKELEAMLAEY